MKNDKLFDVYYKSINNESRLLKGIDKKHVRYELDRLFKDKNMMFAGVTKHKSLDLIFYHSVFKGTIIIDRKYRATTMKYGRLTIKLEQDGHKPVKSSYPRWYYGLFDNYSYLFNYPKGKLDIEKLLENTK